VIFLRNICFKLDSSELESIKLDWHHFVSFGIRLASIHTFLLGTTNQLDVEHKMVCGISCTIDINPTDRNLHPKLQDSCVSE
jgi:hypothetical protein